MHTSSRSKSLKDKEQTLLYSTQDEKATFSGQDDAQRRKRANRGMNGKYCFRVPFGVVVRGALGWEEGAYCCGANDIARREC
jgi:hypothetical protein